MLGEKLVTVSVEEVDWGREEEGGGEQARVKCA